MEGKTCNMLKENLQRPDQIALYFATHSRLVEKLGVCGIEAYSIVITA
jgi:hypothetical protein